ncbi:hypothetical protein H6G27_32960 [Nostoc linckia FACHB-104]|nr:hypothetical protein [Nostoc linckia FACHB-104]
MIHYHFLAIAELLGLLILGRLPERIQASLITRATEIEYPIEAVIEMAIASFLDTEALGFADCKPGLGQ